MLFDEVTRAFAKITRKIYIVDNLKTNILIEVDILISKLISLLSLSRLRIIII